MWFSGEVLFPFSSMEKHDFLLTATERTQQTGHVAAYVGRGSLSQLF